MNYKEHYKYYKKKYINLKYGGSSVDTYENDMIYDLNFLIDNNEVIPDVLEVEKKLMEVDSKLQIAEENKESQSVLNKYIKEMGALQVLLDFSRDFQYSSGATFDRNGYLKRRLNNNINTLRGERNAYFIYKNKKYIDQLTNNMNLYRSKLSILEDKFKEIEDLVVS